MGQGGPPPAQRCPDYSKHRRAPSKGREGDRDHSRSTTPSLQPSYQRPTGKRPKPPIRPATTTTQRCTTTAPQRGMKAMHAPPHQARPPGHRGPAPQDRGQRLAQSHHTIQGRQPPKQPAPPTPIPSTNPTPSPSRPTTEPTDGATPPTSQPPTPGRAPRHHNTCPPTTASRTPLANSQQLAHPQHTEAFSSTTTGPPARPKVKRRPNETAP
ncbi:uncharacterized protein [Antennarius striatus]|uniref:uncharacterized protein n=1 Tax=Antennarius striatus TaxID=241820 RepID=UPI0035B2DFAA